MSLMFLLIGNGWISDEYQSPVNLQFAYDNGLIKKGSKGARNIESQQERCIQRLKENHGENVDTAECERILQDILRETQDLSGPKDQACINMYDIKLRDSYPSCGMNWPPDLETVTPYLRNPTLINNLHIDTSKKAAGWTECNGQVSSAFTTRNSKPSFDLLPKILEQVPIILFSGADDLICNHAGTENLIAHLEWNGETGFSDNIITRQWTFEGESAGTYRADRNLTYILFHDSSHMVPFDYPRRSRDMLDRFMGIDPKLRYPGSIIDGEAVTSPAPAPVTPEKPASDSTTSSGPVPTETEMTEDEEVIAQQARWDAYQRSGEVALVFVIIMAGAWGWWVWRDRRQRAGYRGLDTSDNPIMDGVRDLGSGAMRMEAFRPHPERDLEEGAGDGEEMNGKRYEDGGMNGNGVSAEQARRYSLGSASESDDEDDGKKVNGR